MAAKIIEDMLRNEMDRLPFAEINDLMERIVPIQGGGAYLVEWDNTARTHTTIGELNVVPIHPRQMVPQDGVYSGIEDMDYIPEVCCDEYCKYPQQCRTQEDMDQICDRCKLAKMFDLLVDEEN